MSALEFESVKVMKPKANTFDMTHDVKMSGRMGNLMPCLVMEAVPGDKFNLACDHFVRFAPMIAPIFHRVDVRTEYFFVPYRLVWENWEQFIVQEAPVPVSPFVVVQPLLTADQVRFLDYMGVPPMASTGGNVNTNINALALAAYQMIYNEYYRDENNCPEVDFALIDGDNSANTDLFVLRQRAFEHDQFTSCLPFAQKGAPVSLPLGDVTLKTVWDTGTNNPRFVTAALGTGSGDITQVVDGGAPSGFSIANAASFPEAYDPSGTLEVGPTTINDLRTAMRLQEWLEKNARGGTRYIENIMVHFGVRSSDARLQRPEYITGVKSPVIISEVLNTTGDAGGPPQGNMAGHGTSIGDGYTGDYFAEEHGVIIGITSIMPRTAYMQGIPKFYLKNDPYQYAWPEFANLGEEAVIQDEIFAYDPSGGDTVFGYLPRYYEYKQMPSRVAGDFRTSLLFWSLVRDFGSPPTLSQQFIECDATAEDFDRIFAVSAGDDNIYMHLLHKVKVRRLLPVYGTPML